jgi:tetratricopeptide (TPR) repeat protein
VGNDAGKAVLALERAVESDPGDPQILLELDEAYAAAATPLRKRLQSLSAHPATALAKHSTTGRQAKLHVLLGEYDAAFELFAKRHFHVWEGERGIHEWYAAAHLLRGRERLEAGDGTGALADFEAAKVVPDNIEVGTRLGGQDPQIDYHIGLAQEALGREDAAAAAFLASASAEVRDPEMSYFQALAQRKLGEEAEALERFRRLAATPVPDPVEASSFDGAREEREGRARAHYLRALGHSGLGEKEAALADVEHALAADPGFLGARASWLR